MTTRVDIGPQTGRPAGRLLAPVVVVAHGVVLLFLVRVLLDPGWAHLEGKAPVARVVLYPLATALLPLWWSARSRAEEFPWLPQLLVVLICLMDLVGNRLDLYDSVAWFDDAVHGLGSGRVSAAWLFLVLERTSASLVVVAEAVAAGMSASLAWELFEYATFLTRSTEWNSAYSDTVGDLALGWVGAALAGVSLAAARSADR
jgi:hypothetical protein